MNNNIKNTLRIGVVAAAGAAAMLSCTDTWNDHYGPSADPTSGAANGTLMQALETKAPEFAAVVKAVGYDRNLNSNNVYTIWAPQIDGATKDALLEAAKGDSAEVVDKFVKNHIARYAQPLGDKDLKITLLNEKEVVMDVTDSLFGDVQIVASNLPYSNGVLHIINDVNSYTNNLYEELDAMRGEADEISLAKFLEKYNKDSLDENRSVSRGVDENGNKIWVDSVTIRNNTALKNVNAFLYREDSSYTAILPTPEAYKERYEMAAKLLNFNSFENSKVEGYDAVDSLRRYYANMFAMTDLYFSNTVNTHKQDSLKSTNYEAKNWPYGIYYTKNPRQLHHEKSVNDILSKAVEVIDCSNGTAYIVDEYPMKSTEQFFKKISINGRELANSIETTLGDKGVGLYTKDMNPNALYSAASFTYTKKDTIPGVDGEKDSIVTKYTHTQEYSGLYLQATSHSSPKVAFRVPNTLSGKYKIYLVTCPYLVTKLYGNQNWTEADLVSTGYKFYVDIWQRDSIAAKAQEYPKDGVRMNVPEGSEGEGRYFKPTVKFNEYGEPQLTDTLYIGEVNLMNAYYGRDKEGVLIQIQPNTTSGERNSNTFTDDIVIKEIYFMPVGEDDEPAEVRTRAPKQTSQNAVALENKNYIREYKFNRK